MDTRATPPDAPTSPPPVTRVAGLVALVALAAVDAFSVGWDPNPMVYLAAVALIVWGPQVARQGGD